MTALITADWHLNALARDSYRHDWQRELRAFCRSGVTGIYLLGDITDDKDHHPAELVTKVVDHFFELAKLAPVVVLKGNHDYTTLTGPPYFSFLQRLANVYWVGGPTLAHHLPKLPPIALPRDSTLLLPHSPNPTRDWAKIDLKGPDLILAHNTFEGADNGWGHKLAGAPLGLFPKEAAQVISGDVHHPQTLGPVTYVGPPYTVDFGDDYEPRVLIVDRGVRVRSVPCSGPQKRLLEIEPGALPKPKFAKGDILKVRVKLDSGQYAGWAQIKEEVHRWGEKHGLVIHQVLPEVAGTRMPKKAAVRAAPKSDTDVLKAYAKKQDLDDPTYKVGIKLMSRA